MTVRELLEEVKVRITADPSKYNQNTYCDTACCIAGHIDVILNGPEKHVSRGIKTQEAIMQISDIALEALGEPEDIWLFAQPRSLSEEDDDEEDDPDLWPRDLSVEYENATTAAGRAAVGCKAIDRYLEEKAL